MTDSPFSPATLLVNCQANSSYVYVGKDFFALEIEHEYLAHYYLKNVMCILWQVGRTFKA